MRRLRKMRRSRISLPARGVHAARAPTRSFGASPTLDATWTRPGCIQIASTSAKGGLRIGCSLGAPKSHPTCSCA
eukprot:1262399-Pyramimonas_sp.AAC.1